MPSPDFTAAYEAQPVVAQVEGDRFCVGCGYNLRQQPVRIEPETESAMIRCPECGRFASAHESVAASHRWLHRMAGPAVVVWGLGLLAGLFAAGFALFLDLIIMYDTLLNYDYNASSYRQIFAAPATTDEWLGYGIMVAVAGGLGLLVGLAVAVCLPHWNRIASLASAVIWPAAAYACFYGIMRVDPGSVAQGDVDALLIWMVPVIVAAIGCGIAMACVGRVVGRALVRVLLPGKLRTPMGYLWLVDGKTPPTK